MEGSGRVRWRDGYRRRMLDSLGTIPRQREFIAAAVRVAGETAVLTAYIIRTVNGHSSTVSSNSKMTNCRSSIQTAGS